MTNKYWNWLPTYLNFSGIDSWLTNLQQQYISCLTDSGNSTVSVYPIDFRSISKWLSDLHRKLVIFCINRMESFQFNISTTRQCKNFKNISSGSWNDALSMYIPLKKLDQQYGKHKVYVFYENTPYLTAPWLMANAITPTISFQRSPKNK